MDSKARAKLIHLLISKSMVEALLITAVAVGFYFATTNPRLRGVLDNADRQSISGWALDEGHPATRIEIQLFIDDQFADHASADKYRPDVRAAGRSNDDWHGFVFLTPKLSAGEHEARIYAVHSNGGGARRTLQLIGKPFRFRVD